MTMLHRYRSLAAALLASACVTAIACSKSYGEDATGGGDAGVDAPNGGGGDGATPEGSVAQDAALPGAPDTLATGLLDPYGIAATEESVFFTSAMDGVVGRVPIVGGNVEQVRSNAGAPAQIVVSATSLYWLDGAKRSLNRQDLTNPAVQGFVVMNPGVSPVSLGTDGTSVALIALNQNTKVAELVQYTPDLMPASSIPGLANAFDLAVLGTSLYWTESSAATVAMGTMGSTSRTVLSTTESDCQAITADAAGVYWALPNAGVVRAFATNTAGPIDLATGEQKPFAIVADDSGVYWITTDGKLRRKRVDQELPPATLAQGFKATYTGGPVRALALTSKYIVWITSDGNVLRLTK
jgi:streptogramin lyase